MLDNENCIKTIYLVVKRASVERLTKEIMFLDLLTIFISRILYPDHIEMLICVYLTERIVNTRTLRRTNKYIERFSYKVVNR